jgi:hypothetical protein
MECNRSPLAVGPNDDDGPGLWKALALGASSQYYIDYKFLWVPSGSVLTQVERMELVSGL